MQFNEQQVEIIDGLTKLCNGLTRNMKAILEPEGDSEDMGGMGGLGGLGNMSSLLGGMESGDANR
jgi:hypothetical protein